MPSDATNSGSPDEVLAQLAERASSLEPRQIFVVAKSGNSAPDLLRLTLTESLRSDFMKIDAENSESWGKLTLIQYLTSRAVPDSHLMWVRAENVTLLTSLDLSDDARSAVPAFEMQDLATMNLRMTITTSGSDHPNNIRATFFRITRNTARLARSKRLAAVFRNGTFDRIDDEVLLFNHEVDAIACGGYVFFSKKRTFERAFEFLEDLREHASETFTLATRNLAIDGRAELQAAATTDINMMAKRLFRKWSAGEGMTDPAGGVVSLR